jgi:hypothetical protein
VRLPPRRSIKRSLHIVDSRWKQRDIHEKREARNHRIAELEAEVAYNDVLLAGLRAFQLELAQSGIGEIISPRDGLV